MIRQIYNQKCRTPSDINEHLPTLHTYALKCLHITECGVRSATSSYAFAAALLGRGGKIVQVDTKGHANITKFGEECATEGIDVVFHEQSDLECPIEETDLLFIDTWHVYGHLRRELARWNPYTRKFIILHDTTVDAQWGETIRNGWNAAEQSKETGIPVEEINRGLQPAIDEFLAEHPEWRLRQRFWNNNGLTVLERV